MRSVRTWAWVAILITLSDTKMCPREGYISSDAIRVAEK